VVPLKPTTRATHGARHGKTYTTDEVAEFYSDGNSYNCYCANIHLLDDDGKLYNEGLARN
jgi:uncharacterized protein with gpF-like domain